MQSNKTVLDRDEMDRLIMMRADVEKYENETIPALHQHVALLRRALSEYGCHKRSCGMAEQPPGACTCGLEATIGSRRL
jgi:hypothetical protein